MEDKFRVTNRKLDLREVNETNKAISELELVCCFRFRVSGSIFN